MLLNCFCKHAEEYLKIGVFWKEEEEEEEEAIEPD